MALTPLISLHIKTQQSNPGICTVLEIVHCAFKVHLIKFASSCVNNPFFCCFGSSIIVLVIIASKSVFSSLVLTVFPDSVDVSMQTPAKKAFTDAMQHSSSDETCESTNSHLNNDDDSGIETTTPTTPVTSLLFCDTSNHPRLSYCRPKYTPPRSPLARSLSSNSNEENKRYSLDATNCFTFAPVQD